MNNIKLEITNIINNETKIENKEQNKQYQKSILSNLDDINNIKPLNIKIFGIGGAGGNVVDYIANNVALPSNVDIFALNTDKEALLKINGINNLYLMAKKTLRGSGSGGDQKIGQMAAEESLEDIKKALIGTDILFLIAGLGKGTGSGATPIIAKAASEMGILVINIVNMPSIFAEGSSIYKNALNSLEILKAVECPITTISNDKIINSDFESVSFVESFKKANCEVGNIINDLLTMICVPSEMNIDFADIKSFFNANKSFTINRISLANDFTSKKIKENLEKAIKNSFSDITIENSQRVLLQCEIGLNTSSRLLVDVREAFKQLTNNNDITFTNGIKYSKNEDSNISFLISGSDNSSIIDKYNSSNDNQTSDEFIEKFDDGFENVLTKDVNLNKYQTIDINQDETTFFSSIDETNSFDQQLDSDECIKILTKAITEAIDNEKNFNKKMENN